MIKRGIAWLLTAALCCAVALPAWAEEVVSADIESPASPAEWSGAIGLYADTGEAQGLDLPPQEAEQPLALAVEDSGEDAPGDAHGAEPDAAQDEAEDAARPEPKAIELSAARLTIGYRQTCALTAWALDGEGHEIADEKLDMTSSDPKGLRVSAAGVIRGLARGSYTVTVRAANGVQAKCAVRVVKAPSGVSLSPSSPVLGQGQTLRLTASIPSGSKTAFRYYTSNPKVATVSETGLVTAISPGTATVRVKTHNSKTAKVVVTVKKGPRFMTLNGEYQLVYDALNRTYEAVYDIALKRGETFRIKCENEIDTLGNTVECISQNPEVASVTVRGRVKALSGGVAIIEVVSSSGAKALMRVTVSGKKAVSLGFEADQIALEAGQTVPAPMLRGENISAEKLAAARLVTGDRSVFRVKWSDEDGCWMLQGVKPGTATLTASAGGKTARAQVTVFEAAPSQGISFDCDLMYMNEGETCAPRVTDDLGRGVKALLYSDQTDVVDVDESGVMTATGEGTATVTAVSGALQATMTVRVIASAASVTLDQDEITLGVGQRAALKASVNGDGNASGLTFQSSDSAVATVSQTGCVIARGVGTAIITAAVNRGETAACTVNVAPAPSRLALEPASVSAQPGEKVRLKWSFGAPDEVGSVTFRSRDTAIAEVDGKGRVTLKAVGKTTVTAATNNGLCVSIDVTVLPGEPETGATAYRLFAAYSYADSGVYGYLPFPRNNGRSIARVFKRSRIHGQTYQTRIMGNPGKTQLFSGISTFFAETADNDVSIVYLCSHGHMDSDYTGYRMSLPGYSDKPDDANYYLTSREIYNCLKRIRGRVILILDSCYSGAFLQDMERSLDHQDGRIAVMTAASNTRATFYNISDTDRAVDFFTYFLLTGLGYNEFDGWWNKNAGGDMGAYPGFMAADKAGNGDGAVTLGEFYDYAANCIAVNMPSYMKKSWYWGDWKRVQVTRCYKGKLEDLVIYKPGK